MCSFIFFSCSKIVFNSSLHSLSDISILVIYCRNLVNSDFASSSESRDACVEAWKSNPHSLRTTKGGDDVEALSTKVQVGRMSTAETISTSTPSKSDFAASPGSNTNALATMFHRHLLLTVKDPVLYFGRCAVILVTNCIFAFVYWNARGTSQQQVPYQLWLFMWFMVSTLMYKTSIFETIFIAYFSLHVSLCTF